MRRHLISRRRIRKSIAPAAATVVVVAAIALLQYYSGSWPFNRKNDLAVIETNDDEASSFEFLLQRGSVRQLRESLNEIVYRKTDDLTIRLDQLKRRIAILDRILDLPNEDDSQEFAIAVKLEVLLDREVLSVSQGVDSIQLTKELWDFGYSHRDSSNSSIASLALSALAIADMSQFIMEKSTDGRDARLIAAANSLIRVLDKAAYSKTGEVRMVVWLQNFRERCSRREFQTFYQAIDGSDSDSPLLMTIRNTFGANSFGLPDVLDAVQSERDSTADELLVQLKDQLKRNDLTRPEFTAVLHRIGDLLRLGMVERAKEALGLVEAAAARNSVSEETRSLLALNKKEFHLFESAFDLTGLMDLTNDQPAAFKEDQSKYKILFLMPTQNNRDSISKFQTLLAIVERSVLDRKIEFATVYVNKNNTKLTDDDKSEMAKQKEHWRFWLLDPAKEDASQFLNQLNIDQYPYMIVLGHDQRVAFLNPPLDIIAELDFQKQGN